MIGFVKDIQICLTAIRHPTEPKLTVAFSPALGTCCATLDFLSCLFSGRRNGPHIDALAKYAERYLAQPAYDREHINVLVGAFRNMIAHRGIVSGVWLERPDLADSRRIAWRLTASNHWPAIRVTLDAGEDPRAPWPCRHSHRAHIHVGRLARDIAESAQKFSDELVSSGLLQRNFERALTRVYPKD